MRVAKESARFFPSGVPGSGVRTVSPGSVLVSELSYSDPSHLNRSVDHGADPSRCPRPVHGRGPSISPWRRWAGGGQRDPKAGVMLIARIRETPGITDGVSYPEKQRRAGSPAGTVRRGGSDSR